MDSNIDTTQAKTEMEKPMNGLILGASVLSVLISLVLVRRNSRLATFTGLWAPTILGLGAFFKENKLLDLERRKAA